MKKLIAVLLVALMTLGAAALAETYRSDDLSFEYDEKAFEITVDDRSDDETNVVLYGTNEAWGITYVNIYLKDLEDGEKFPTADELAKANNAAVTQGEWNGFENVFMFTLEDDDNGVTRSFFVRPVTDDDGKEIENLLSVQIGTSKIDDEATLQARDDAISAIVDSLKTDD